MKVSYRPAAHSGRSTAITSSSRNAPPKKAAAGDPFANEADRFVGTARAAVVGKYAERNAVRISVTKNSVDEFAKQPSSVATTGMTNSYPLYVQDAFGRCPIAHDGEADGFRAAPGNKISGGRRQARRDATPRSSDRQAVRILATAPSP